MYLAALSHNHTTNMLKRLALLLLLSLTAIPTFSQGSFIRVIKSGSKYKFEIPDSLLGQDILFGSRIVDISAPSAKVYSAGQMRSEPVLIRFDKRDNLIVIEEINNFVDVDSNDPIKEPLARNMKVGGVEYFDIESRNSANSASIIDVTKYFSNEVQLAWPLPDNVKKGKLDSKLSELQFVKQHTDRVNIRTYYEFLGGKETFTITVQYFLLQLPKEPLRYRLDDERVGYQNFKRKAFASGKPISSNQYISRWRIEPAPADMAKHRAGELVEPQKQLVFYIEPYFPKDWIPYIKQGIEVWNKAFEKIGFKNVVVAKDFPENDPNFDPYDIKTNVIRYLPVDEANAAGQIWTDPRSGEIINGEVLWWNNVVELINKWRFMQTGVVDPQARALVYEPDFMGEMIRYAIAHEIGHILGMQHNLKSSYAYPTDSLRSPSFTQKYGTTASIMDYARFNHIAEPGDLERGVKLTPPMLGAFDFLSVEYGYIYLHNAKTPADEVAALDSLLKSQSHNPMCLFSPFITSAISPDPSAQTESLGNDVLRSSARGIENTQVLLTNLVEWTLQYGGKTSDIEDRYDALLKQYYRYISLSMSYLGGKYTVYGPLNQERTRYIPVDKAKQKEALRFAVNHLFNAPTYLDQAKLTAVIGSQTDNILKRQAEVTQTLLSNLIIPRIFASTANPNNDYSLTEYLHDLDELIMDTKPNTPYQKGLQVVYILSLKNLAKIASPDDASKVAADAVTATTAYAQLQKTKQRLQKLAKRGGQNGLHYQYLISLL